MEYIKGSDLFNEMEILGVFDEKKAAKLIHTVLEAINHIHSNGVVHRDLKPDNIMVDENNEPKIIDFGLSKDIGQHIRQLKSMVGSKMFMAPEII
jgi:serine/threonine protein kinase